MNFLNFHHLKYFYVVAKEGSLRRAAERLHVSQPAISAQIAALESALGEKLFRRNPRGNTLTETGRLALSYAEEIFTLGQDFLQAIIQHPSARSLHLHIGIADSLPKLVSHEIIRPIFGLEQEVQAVCLQGKTSDLLAQLAVYRLDIVLTDEPAPSSMQVKTFNHLLGQSGVSFCVKAENVKQLKFPQCLHNERMLLPTSNTALRRTLEKWFNEREIHPRVIAEYEDSALMRIAGEDGLGIFPLPTVAVAEAQARYGVKSIGEAKGCTVQFYAISAERKLTHPAVLAITSNARGALFARRTGPKTRFA